jgi:hypothetical protein
VFTVYMLALSYAMQLLSQSQSKASSKKRKRLDKYIVRAQYLHHENSENSFSFSGEKAAEGRACRVVRETCVGGPLSTASINFIDLWIK